MDNELRGACIIGQSGGPTAVINASAYGVIKTALEATGSTLPQMLENFGQMLAAYVKENGTLHEMKDLPEGPFIAIETEFAKLREYIEGLEDGTPGKAKALGVLNLLHEYVDDVHQAIDGHAHQEPAK